MIKMSVFNKINDNLIVDTFKNVFQRGSSEVFQPDIPECRTIQKYMLHCQYRWPAQLTASAINRLGQYARSPGNRVYCYLELAVSSLAMTVTIASTHCPYPRRDGQAELTWVVD